MSHNINTYVEAKKFYTDSQLDRRQLPRGYANEVYIPSKMVYQGEQNPELEKIPKHEDTLLPTPEVMREIMPEGPPVQIPPAMLVNGGSGTLPEKMGMQWWNTPITIDGALRSLGSVVQEFIRYTPAAGMIPIGQFIYALVTY